MFDKCLRNYVSPLARHIVFASVGVQIFVLLHHSLNKRDLWWPQNGRQNDRQN